MTGNFRPVDFKVVDLDCEGTDPAEYGIVTERTEVFTAGDPINREEEDKLDGIGYDDIGGCQN